MNDITKQLVQFICENNLQQAKKIVTNILENDKTQKDTYFRKRMQNLLHTQSLNLMELPYEVKGLLVLEDVSTSFHKNRYYLSEAEKKLTEQILRMRNASRKLGEMGIAYLNSTMLFGESGTGKTTYGRYLAYKLDIPFAYLNFSNAIDSLLGKTTKNISKVFDYVKNTDCVFMLDEVDAIGLKRGKESVGEMARVVIGLMQNLDLLGNDVVLIGATNRIDMMDEALLRRFSIHHEVKQPDASEQFQLISKFLQDIGVSLDEKELTAYCSENHTQFQIHNDIVRALAVSFMSDSEFSMS